MLQQSTIEKPNLRRFGRRRLVELGALALMVWLILASQAGTSTRLYDSSDLSASQEWNVSERGAYLGHEARYTTSNGTLVLEADEGFEADAIEIAVFDYPDTDTSILARSANGVTGEAVLPGEGLGDITVRIEADEPFAAPVTLTADIVGEGTVVVDSVTLVGRTTSMTVWVLLGAGVVATLFAVSYGTIAASPSSGRSYHSIDVLRAFAVLIVLALHAQGYSGLPALEGMTFMGDLAPNGHYGVEIFYVLSAYTLMFSLLAAVARSESDRLFRFWVKRIVRILPSVLVIFLAIAVVLAMVGDLEGFFRSLWRLVTMSYIFDEEAVRLIMGHSVWWSIATEFQFYLVMPLAFLGLLAWLRDRPRLGASLVAAAMVLLVGVVVAAGSRGAFAEASWLARTLLYHADAFAFGAALAIGTHRVGFGRGSPRVWAAVTASASLLLVYVVLHMDDVYRVLPRSDFRLERLVLFSAVGLVLLSARSTESTRPGTFDLPILRSLGQLSFMIYLLHVPVMAGLMSLGFPSALGSEEGVYVWVLLLAVAASAVFGLVVHRTVEMPALQRTGAFAARPYARIVTMAYVAAILGFSLFFGLRAVSEL